MAKVESTVATLNEQLAAEKRCNREHQEQLARMAEQLRAYQDKNNVRDATPLTPNYSKALYYHKFASKPHQLQYHRSRAVNKNKVNLQIFLKR